MIRTVASDTLRLKRIVIVGGGAAGIELATRLGRRHKRNPNIEVTLVDRSYSHLWKPLLHEVAAGTLNSSDDELSYLAQAHWNHFKFRIGALQSIDRDSKRITISPSYDSNGHEYIPARSFSYDVLVIAIGSVTNDFGTKGVAEHCFFLDSREQADAFHQHLVRACYTADSQPVPIHAGQLHIAIAGAGATGVELAAELHYSLRELVSFGLDHIDVERDIRIHLIEGSDRILPALPEHVAQSTREILDRIGVEVHTGEIVSEATAEGFATRSGTFFPAEIKIWTAGIRGPDILTTLAGLETNRSGQLLVRKTLQTTIDDSVFAIGDCAACPMSTPGRLVPPRAQAAHQQASLLVDSIERYLAGRPLAEYVYKDFGSLINLSEHTAIGTLMGNVFGRESASVPLEGRLARWAYLSLYKLHQLVLQGVLRTALTTIADILTRTSKPRLKLH